jgi:hypothetical protein
VESALAAFKAMVRDLVGPALRSEGFKGSGGTFTLTVSSGDCAVVNVQSSQFNTAEEVRFIVNLAVIPEPWWGWQVSHLGSAVPKTPRESLGLWRDRLHPTAEVSDGRSEPWWLVRDEASAVRCGQDVNHQLTTGALARLRRLLDRDTMLAAVRSGDFGFVHFHVDAALAVLLADEGESAELTRVLVRLASEPDDRRRAYNERIIAWVHERVAIQK